MNQLRLIIDLIKDAIYIALGVATGLGVMLLSLAPSLIVITTAGLLTYGTLSLITPSLFNPLIALIGVAVIAILFLSLRTYSWITRRIR